MTLTKVKTRKLFTSIVSIAMIVCTLFCMSIPTSAATNSSGTKTRTITVTTKANWWIPGSESITLKQTKGTCSVTPLFAKKAKVSSVYGCWDVVATATDGSHTVRKNFDGSSVKLNLKPNKTYIITISWDDQASFLRTANKGNWTAYPTWKVKSTWKVSSYY